MTMLGGVLLLSPEDDLLAVLQGAVVPSGDEPGVTYKLEVVLGAGSFAVAFLAMRIAPDGQSPVVMKIVRPRMMRDQGETAMLAFEKETVALGRLKERVPPTPFVVRLIDSHVIRVMFAGVPTDLPWLALEYVHGGAEGTTLDERVDFSVEQTGYAFDPERAALALTCLAGGLEAIHEVDVVHRDVTPWNVLCCGFGSDELFKIADFGIARPQGSSTGTFVGSPGGTPGYAAPEQVRSGKNPVGPATDVFSLASVVFRMLTGEEYFEVGSTLDGVLAAQEAARRGIRECRSLCPELAERPHACAAIDASLAHATAYDPAHRPQSVWEFAASVLRALRPDPVRHRPPRRRLESITDASVVARFAWTWHVRHNGGDRVVRSVAWEGDGRCLAATGRGLAFWDGMRWVDAPSRGLPNAGGIRFVQRVEAGLWLVGGDEATIAHYSRDGVSSVLRAADPSVTFLHASGEIGDLAVLVGARPEESPVLYTLAAHRWLKPAALSKAASVSALARVTDDRWLIAGRSLKGDGFAAVYAPLMFEVRRIKTDAVKAFHDCAAQPDLGLGVAAGAAGRVLRVTKSGVRESVVPREHDLSCCRRRHRRPRLDRRHRAHLRAGRAAGRLELRVARPDLDVAVRQLVRRHRLGHRRHRRRRGRRRPLGSRAAQAHHVALAGVNWGGGIGGRFVRVWLCGSDDGCRRQRCGSDRVARTCAVPHAKRARRQLGA